MNGERFPVFSYLSQKGGDILVRSDFSCLRPRENNGGIIPGSPFFIQINFPAAAGRAVLQTAQTVHFYTQFSSRRRPALFPARHRVPSNEPHALLPVSPVVCTVSFTPFTPLIQFLRPSLCSRQGEARQSPDHGAETPKEQPHRPEGYRVFGVDQTRRSAFKTPRTSCKIVYQNAGISFERSNHETKRLFQKNRRKMRKVSEFLQRPTTTKPSGKGVVRTELRESAIGRKRIGVPPKRGRRLPQKTKSPSSRTKRKKGDFRGTAGHPCPRTGGSIRERGVRKKTPSRLTPPFFAWGANILVRSDFLAPNPRKKNEPIIPARGKSIQINFPISRKKPFLPYFVKLPRLARRISPGAKLSLFRNGPIRTGSLFPFFPEDEAETSLFRRQKEL